MIKNFRVPEYQEKKFGKPYEWNLKKPHITREEALLLQEGDLLLTDQDGMGRYEIEVKIKKIKPRFPSIGDNLSPTDLLFCSTVPVDHLHMPLGAYINPEIDISDFGLSENELSNYVGEYVDGITIIGRGPPGILTWPHTRFYFPDSR